MSGSSATTVDPALGTALADWAELSNEYVVSKFSWVSFTVSSVYFSWMNTDPMNTDPMTDKLIHCF